MRKLSASDDWAAQSETTTLATPIPITEDLFFLLLTDATPAALQQAYHTLIPISQHMGVKVISYDGQCLRVSAPLANNINHQRSAFGGSLFSLVALAGWGILQLKTTELQIDCTTVIAGGEVTYQLPVFSELVCECRLPTAYDAFVERLATTGKASLTLDTAILLDGTPAMSFSGKYVVRRNTNP